MYNTPSHHGNSTVTPHGGSFNGGHASGLRDGDGDGDGDGGASQKMAHPITSRSQHSHSTVTAQSQQAATVRRCLTEDGTSYQ